MKIPRKKCIKFKNLRSEKVYFKIYFIKDYRLSVQALFKLDEDDKLVSEVFRTGKGKIVKNIINECYVSNLREKLRRQIRSQVAVPLWGESEKPIGVLLLNSTNDSHFSKDHLELLNALAEFGTAAFQNSKIISKLEMLSEASNVLLKEYENKTLEEKFDFIVKKTNEVLDAELCSLFLVQDNKLILITTYSIEDDSEAKKRKKEDIILPIISGYKTGMTGAIGYNKKVYNAYGEKHRNHPAVKNPDESDFLPSKYCYSELAYPILDDNGELVGLLLAHNKRDESGRPLLNAGFSKEFDEPLMKILTTKLIISIKNAALLNRLSNSLNKLKDYELIIETTPDPVVITNRRGLITYMNKGAAELFGNLQGEMIAHYYYTDERSTGREKALEIMRKLAESKDGHIKNVDTIFTSKGGNPVPLSVSACLLKNEKGNVVGTIGIGKDLREIKTLLDVGNSLLSTYDINDILKKITNECLRLQKSKRAYIKLYDGKKELLVVRALSSRNPREKLHKEHSPGEMGMTTHVFKTQKPYISADVSLEPPERYFKTFPNVKSKIGVPINSIDKETGAAKTLGVISIDSEELSAFSVNDEFFLSTLASQAAAAIENANLIASKIKIITELSAIRKVQETIAKTLDVDQILESVLDVVVKILGFDYASISRVDFSTGKIGTVKGRNVSSEFLKMAWHPLNSNDIQAWVVKNKEEVKLAGWNERLDKKIYDRFNHQNLIRIYLPIISRDESFGTLETGYNKKNRQEIFEDEIQTLRKVVNLAGIGIDQAYLLGEQKKLVDQLQALNQASVYIQSSRTEEEVIKHIFRSLERIGYIQGMLSLVNETTGKIEGRYALGANWERIKKKTKCDLTSHDILAIAIQEKHSILIKDCASDHRCNHPAIKKAGIKSQYIIPLIINEKAIGTLQIDLSDRQDLVNGPADVLNRRMDVIETFASQIAIAIRNVRDREIISLLETTLMETAHEFRSPLHNILAQIGGLKSHLPEGYGKEREINEIFKIISEEAHRASKQMENTLLFSERSRGLMGLNFEEGYIQDIVQQCVNSYRMRALERGISIVVKDNLKKLPPFKFDKHKIEQVINNLLDNAVKYSHFHRFIQIRGFDDGTKINIDIWDKGLGIPEEEFDNIFEGFTRGNIKDKKRYIPGTGLGLKISKEIVKGHGGEIKVKSTPFFNDPRKIKEFDGYDTIFTIILPKKPRER